MRWHRVLFLVAAVLTHPASAAEPSDSPSDPLVPHNRVSVRVLDGFVQSSPATGADVTGQAWGGSFDYVNVGPMAAAQVQRIGAGFNPALGYLAEAAVLRGLGTVGWWQRTDEGASVIPAVDGSFRRTLDGAERTRLLNPEVAYTS